MAYVLLLLVLAVRVLLAVILQTAGQCCDIVSLCCYRNNRVCRLAVHAESSWQTASKARHRASHPRLVLAQHRDLASPGVMIHVCVQPCLGLAQVWAISCPSSTWVGVIAHPHRGGSCRVPPCLVGERLLCPAQVQAISAGADVQVCLPDLLQAWCSVSCRFA